jgi:hypothetical protein
MKTTADPSRGVFYLGVEHFTTGQLCARWPDLTRETVRGWWRHGLVALLRDVQGNPVKFDGEYLVPGPDAKEAEKRTRLNPAGAPRTGDQPGGA